MEMRKLPGKESPIWALQQLLQRTMESEPGESATFLIEPLLEDLQDEELKRLATDYNEMQRALNKYPVRALCVVLLGTDGESAFPAFVDWIYIQGIHLATAIWSDPESLAMHTFAGHPLADGVGDTIFAAAEDRGILPDHVGWYEFEPEDALGDPGVLANPREALPNVAKRWG